MHYLTNYYKNLCEQLQDRINVLSKLLSEESDEEWSQKHQEWLNSIHDMPVEEAQSHGELDLVAGGKPLFIEGGYRTKINDNHGFTKFLTHPDHSNESALEHMNFLLKVAHSKDHAGGIEKIYHFGNEHQSAVFDFARENYPTLAYAMAEVAQKANKIRRGSTRAGSKMIPSKEPIQITPEHLDQINREHGVIKLASNPVLLSWNSRGFINSHKKHLMSGSSAEEHIDTF